MVLPSHIPPLAWGRACAFWAGAFFFGAKGNTALFTDLKVPALIEREGRTRYGPPFTHPSPCVGDDLSPDLFFCFWLGN